MKKNPLITQATRSALLDAFWQLYLVTPLDRITVRAVSDLAGYNRSTFYQYFRDVYDVLETVEDIVLDSMDAFISKIHQHARQMSLLEIISVFQADHHASTCYMQGLLSNHGDPAFERKLIQHLKGYFIKWFSLEQLDPYLRDYLLEYHMNGIIGALKHSIRSHHNPTPRQMIEVLAVISGHSLEALSQVPIQDSNLFTVDTDYWEKFTFSRESVENS